MADRFIDTVVGIGIKLCDIFHTSYGWGVAVFISLMNFMSGYGTAINAVVVCVTLDTAWGIAAQINANTTISSTYGWAATVDSDERIIMSSNTFSPVYATIEVVGGCTITRPAEDVNYQTALTGVLIESASENIRRRNNVNSSFAGCNPEYTVRQFDDYSPKRIHKGGQSRISCSVSHLRGLPVRGAPVAVSFGIWGIAPRRERQYKTYRNYALY